VYIDFEQQPGIAGCFLLGDKTMNSPTRKFGLDRYTLDRFFAQVQARYPDRPALALVGEEPFTYMEFGRRVRELQARLRSLGISAGDKVVILGSSSPNWGIAFLALTTMGAVAVPILEEFPEADIDHIIRHSDAIAVFIAPALHANLNLRSLEEGRIVLSLGDFSLLSPEVSGKTGFWKGLQDFGGKVLKSFEKTAPAPELTIQEDDLAEIIYTSGTTGHSKGVMLTHRNLVSNLFEGPDLIKCIHERSVILSILPLAHTFGSTSGFLSIIRHGALIYFLNKPPAPKVLLAAMQEVKPTIFGAVPLVFEKIYHKQVVPTIAASRLLRMLSKTRASRRLLYKIIGRKIGKLLGGRLECVIIGGASFSPEVETFMQQGRIPYCCGYGLTECSPLVTFSSMEEQKMGSPGHAISDVSLRIFEPDPATGIGEILVKGPNIMQGYYKNEAETLKVFTADGWFITGDRGYLDDDGFLFITGRSKNVIVGPSGENIYPETIEARLLESIYVEETLVYMLEGQLVARIFPNYAYLESLQSDRTEGAVAKDIAAILEEVRKEVNLRLPAFSRISRVIEQPSPFIKTPTNKIKRGEYVPGYSANSGQMV
jgi:long-chain acyl-CoA synthetase